MSAASSGQAPLPQVQLMQMAMGYTVPCLLRAAAELRLADYLATGPKTAEEISGMTGTHGPALYRLLRTLACIGVFNQDESDRFSLTPLAEPLRSDIPGSLRTSILSITGDLFTVPWSKLAYSVQTGRSAFDKHFGVPFFDHLNSNPEDAAMFSDLLIGINSADAPAIAAAHAFSSCSHIADIGGGTGHILATILENHPGPRGTVFDLPFNEIGSAELVKSRGLSDRMSFVAGSFFDGVPSGGDVYLLRQILHDWPDDRARDILKACRRSMPAGAELLVMDQTLPERATNNPESRVAFEFDLHMFVLFGARERTAPELSDLIQGAGFVVERILPTDPESTFVAVAN